MLPGGCVFLVTAPATSLAVGGDTLAAFGVIIWLLCITLDAAGFAVQGRCSLHLPVTAAAVGGHRSCACLLGVKEQLLLNLVAVAVVGIVSNINGADCLAVSIRHSDGSSVTGLAIVTQHFAIVIQIMSCADI